MADIELLIKIPEDAYKATCVGRMLPQDVENIVQGIKNGIPLEEHPNRCDSCTHSDDEIIKALKAIRTIHNGNYAPQIDEAIRRLMMQKSAYVQVNLSDKRIQKAVAEAVEKMKAEIEAQPTDAVSRQDVDAYIAKLMSGYLYDEERTRLEEFSAYLWELPSVTPRTNLAETSQDCISILNRIMEYTYGMLTAEKIGLQHLIKSMIDEMSGGGEE